MTGLNEECKTKGYKLNDRAINYHDPTDNSFVGVAGFKEDNENPVSISLYQRGDDLKVIPEADENNLSTVRENNKSIVDNQNNPMNLKLSKKSKWMDKEGIVDPEDKILKNRMPKNIKDIFGWK